MPQTNNIEIRSEEVQEILGHIPNWVIRWGITVIFLTLLILFVGSAFFKYPDVINSQIVVTTENPPAFVVARSNGKIETIFVEDKQKINKNSILAIIENTADYKDVIKLSLILDSIQLFSGNNNDTSYFYFLNNNFVLGELQTNYSQFVKIYSDYINFIKLDYHYKKTIAINGQIAVIQEYINNVAEQKNILANELSIAKKQLERDSLLLSSGAISSADFEKTQSMFLQKKYSLQTSKASLSNIKIQISQLQQSILDLQLARINETNNHKNELKKTYDILKSSIKTWEHNYILRTPIDGEITFTKIWSENQNVSSGEIVFSIVPESQSKKIGRLQLPIAGAGKVEVNQKVNIKFDNYPFMEYGMVQGNIKSISLVPSENFYLVQVNLPDTLISNYGKKLQFSQEMSGTAEIITEDISLLSRLFSPIKYIKEKIF